MHHQLRRKSSGPGKKHKVAGTLKNLVELQPFHLDFGMEGGHGLQCSTTVEDTLELTNNHKSNIPFSISVWSASSQAKITCEPMSGTIKKKSTTTVKLTLTTTASKVGIVRAVVAVQFGELGQFFSLIHLKASCICFGVNPEELDIVSDGEYNVPEVLVILKNCLREHGGFHQEGIFRLAGDELETADVKRRLNLGTFTRCQDMNCIATLIKVWFRELPRQVLGTVDTNSLCEGCSECLMEERKVVEALPEMERALFMWLVDLCIEVALLQQENKMTVRNLAIVIAPNLATPSPGDALQSLSGLGKLVGFVRTIILSRVQEKKALGLLCDADLDWES
ncbi:Rho GTPase activating protein 18 [Balamuthia mandrillaris]